MKIKKLSILTSTLLASTMVISQGLAADVVANPGDFWTHDTSPGVYFNDTGDANNGSWGYSWFLGGFAEDFRLIRNNLIIVQIDQSSNTENTMIVDSLGDINLADGSVFIDRSANQMGIGTSIPATEIHTVGGDTPTLRLDQDGSGGWSPQIWDVAGNETNFFVRDVTNGSTLPFRIQPGAPTSSIYINSTGDIGIGTSSPTAKLDVQGDITSTWTGSNTVGDGLTNLVTLTATNSDVGGSITSDAGFRLVNGSTSKGWNFRTNSGGDSFQATLQGTGGSEFTVTNATANVSGTELYLGNGAKNVGGVWINASSRALKENIKPLSTKEALTAFSKLQPVTYNYKTDKSEKVVGFIAEDVPELVSINSRDGLSSMDMVAVLTKVVQEQDKSLAETKAELKKAQEKIAKQDTKITKLETMQKKVAQLESILTNLALDTSKTQKEKVSFNLK